MLETCVTPPCGLQAGGDVPHQPSLPGVPPGMSPGCLAQPAGRAMTARGRGLSSGAAINKVTADPGQAEGGGDGPFPGLTCGQRPRLRDWLASRGLALPWPPGLLAPWPQWAGSPRGPCTGLPFFQDINIQASSPASGLRAGGRDGGTQVVRGAPPQPAPFHSRTFSGCPLCSGPRGSRALLFSAHTACGPGPG